VTINFARYFSAMLFITVIAPGGYFMANGIYLKSPIASLGVIVVGWASFYLGYKYIGRPKVQWHNEFIVYSRLISLSAQLFITSLVMVSYYFAVVFRLQFNIGLPDYSPTIRFAGVYYYFLTYGFQAVLLAVFLLSRRYFSNYIVLFMGLMGYGIYEGYLGWRTGLLESMFLVIACRLFIIKRAKSGAVLQTRIKFLALLFISTFVMWGVVQLQAAARDSFNVDIITKIAYRFWGANFLDTSVTYFMNAGYGFWTNDSHYIYLLENNITSAEFNNQQIHGNAIGQKHGNSKTGFGSMYIYAGALGTGAAFLITGAYLKVLSRLALESKTGVSVITALMHIPLLFKVINEQLDLGTINSVVAVIVVSYVVTLLISLLRRLKYKTNNKHQRFNSLSKNNSLSTD